MAARALHRDGWSLREATEPDIETLMQWFPKYQDIHIWGGPSFRYPFDRNTFFEDLQRDRMASFCLRDPDGRLVGFGQIYDRDARIHLARLVVRPGCRGQGAGRRLIEMLIEVGRSQLSRDEVSLFVYRENTAAYNCYRALGFAISDYPADMPHADVCDFLTRRAHIEET